MRPFSRPFSAGARDAGPEAELILPDTPSVLFVCMGNICRSPTAEGVFRTLVTQRGLDRRIAIGSAGTLGAHAGAPPDRRSAAAAHRRGYDLTGQKARQVNAHDLARFRYVLAMDNQNLRDLEQLFPGTAVKKVRLFTQFSVRHHGVEVPDPYYGGQSGFEVVLDIIEDAGRGLLDHIVKNDL